MLSERNRLIVTDDHNQGRECCALENHKKMILFPRNSKTMYLKCVCFL